MKSLIWVTLGSLLVLACDPTDPRPSIQPKAPKEMVWDASRLDPIEQCVPTGRYATAMKGHLETSDASHTYCWMAAAGEVFTLDISTGIETLGTVVDQRGGERINMESTSPMQASSQRYTAQTSGWVKMTVYPGSLSDDFRERNWYEVIVRGFPRDSSAESDALTGDFEGEFAAASATSNTLLRTLRFSSNRTAIARDYKFGLNPDYYSARACVVDGSERSMQYRLDSRFLELDSTDERMGTYFERSGEDPNLFRYADIQLGLSSHTGLGEALVCDYSRVVSASVAFGGRDVTVSVRSEPPASLASMAEVIVDLGHGELIRQPWAADTVHTVRDFGYDMRIRVVARGADNLFSEPFWVGNKPKDKLVKAVCIHGGATGVYRDGNDHKESATDIYAFPFSLKMPVCDEDVFRIHQQAGKPLHLRCNHMWPGYTDSEDRPGGTYFEGSKMVDDQHLPVGELGVHMSHLGDHWVTLYANVPSAATDRTLYLTIDGFFAGNGPSDLSYTCLGTWPNPY